MQCKTAECEYFGDPGDCDVCGRPLKDEPFFSDAQLPAHGGQWGVLCRTCTVTEGVRAGWGRAQFYEREPSSSSGPSASSQSAEVQWRCVAGRPPAEFTELS